MENKKIDCPLCGAIGVISQEEYSSSTITTPAPSGTIGNSRIVHTGGKWDFSHSKECKKLEGVLDKEGLLRFFTNNVEIWHGDVKSFEDYNDLLGTKNLKIIPYAKREEGRWLYQVCIQEIYGHHRKELFTKGRDFDGAFFNLRHRLLCGEIIEFDSQNKFQVLETESNPEIFQIF